MSYRKTCIFLISFLFAVSVFANTHTNPDTELQALLQLDLEDLPSISIASKREERIQDAPGVITLVTAEEISRFGYRNLRDILDRQTHMQVIGSNTFPHNRVTLRGIAFTHTDNNVLLLINGRPFRDASSTSLNHDFYSTFPVESIKQIEIIRGPGSVLYGTNAFAGAINIITKNAPDSPGGNLALTYGSFDSKKLAASGGGKWGDLEVFATVNALDVDGDDFHNITDESLTTGTYETGVSGANLILHAKYKGFTLQSYLTDTTRDHARSTFTLPSTDMDLERQYINIGYEHVFTDAWKASLNYSYHHFRDTFLIDGSGLAQLGDADDHFLELTTEFSPIEQLRIIAGGSYNLKDGMAELGDLDWNTYDFSAYLQADYWLFEWLKVIGGLQYNKPEDISGDLSFRLAAVTHFNDNWGMKLLYGQAFRNASPIERYVVAPTILGNPSLQPEQIDTFDAQLFYNGSMGSFSFTYFHSTQSDLITRVGLIPQTFANTGEVDYDGIELEGKLVLGHGFEFIGNLSYQTNEQNNGDDDVTYAPDWMVKTGLNYNNGNGINLGIFNSYFASSTLQNIDINPGVAIVNPEADSYNLLTANLQVNLGTVLNNSALNPVTLSLYGDNLLDEDIFFPSINRRAVNTIPHHHGRGFFGTIQVDF